MRRHVPPFRRGNVLKRLGNSHGSLLILSYLFIATVLLWGVAGFGQSTVAVNASERYRGVFQAFHLAEAAVDEAIAQLRTGTISNVPTTSMATGTYWATIAALSDSPSGTYQIQAFGQVSGIQQQVEAVVRQTPQSVFRYALFGYSQLKVKNGALTDSYNSTQGNYNPNSPGTNGNIGTNNIAAHSVRLSNGAAINGQVFVGLGVADPTTAVDNQGSIITGTPQIVSMTQALGQPAVSTAGLSCSQKLELKNGETFTLTQTSSPYCYAEVLVENSSTLEVSGNVMLYTGKLVVKNSALVNYSPTSKPAPQLIVQITSTHHVLIDNSAQFVGAIYAPNAKADIKNSAILYGAIVAEEVVADNSASIHYDEALADQSAPPDTSYKVILRSWRVP